MKHLVDILKGLWIGSTMVYKEPRKQLPFLIHFGSSAGVGFVVFSQFITLLLENQVLGEFARFFFCGIVAGGIPLLVQKAEVKKINVKSILGLLLGAGVVFALSFIP